MRDWIAAARPRTLTAAIVPVVVAGAAARRSGAFEWTPFWLTLLGAVSIQIAANFANDASDAQRGADPSDRIGPPRMVATGRLAAPSVWRACWGAITLAAFCGLLLTVRVGPVMILIGVASVLAMLGYVGGPKPYGYRGLGEAFVFVFFGLVGTVGSRLAYDGRSPAFVWWLGVPIGLLAAAILMANNLRDLPLDRRVGKRTLAVLLGDRAAINLFFGTIWAALALTLVLAVVGIEPIGVAAGIASGALVFPLMRLPLRPDDRRTYVPLLAGTARIHALYGALVAAGLLL